jgi:hypothetical protein
MHTKQLLTIFVAVVGFGTTAVAGQYKNFNVAIYIAARTTQQLSEPKVLEQQFERVWSQVKFDKVYIETYRDSVFVDEASIERVKKFFESKGIAVAGGITPAKGGQGGQFGTFDYEDPAHRDECKRAVELTARHFDEIILDDFFFYTTKSDADIKAKGARSWTQYRLEKKREVAENLILKPAKAVNPRAKVIIKYPNWYEHFQGLGYDLDIEAKKFDFIYTGTETRDPEITDQLLQQYQSYLTFRYFDNIRPNGGNRGGWVDTFSTRYVDRYAEQLWNTLFAKAPEITLFSWSQMASPQKLAPGERTAWQDQPTSFRWNEMTQAFKGDAGWARAAGYSLEQVDRIVGKLGQPIGVASYKPYQSDGEDFLHNYLGNLGIPIELTPHFPADADIVLLTESAKHDQDIVAKMKRQLANGRNVVITSGLLRALQGKGIEDIAEIEYTGRKAAIKSFLIGYGAGNGTSLNEPGVDNRAILFPELRFHTNDSWPVIRGVANAKGFPLLLMNRYSKGILYVLNIPDNFGDLYDLPRPAVTAIKGFVQGGFPIRIDSDSHVSLFAYDNGAFIVQSYRDSESEVTISIAGANRRLRRDEVDVPPKSQPPRPDETATTTFTIRIPAHSYQLFNFL